MTVAWNREERGFILEIKKWRGSRRNKKAHLSFGLRKCPRIYLLPSCTDKPPQKSVNWWGIPWWAWLQRGGTHWVAFVHTCALVNTCVRTHTLLCMVKTTVSMGTPFSLLCNGEGVLTVYTFVWACHAALCFCCCLLFLPFLVYTCAREKLLSSLCAYIILTFHLILPGFWATGEDMLSVSGL